MGYASYLEDIREKMTDELLEPVRQLVCHLKSEKQVDAAARLRALMRVAEQLVEQLDKAVELATDPHVELASRCRGLESEKTQSYAANAMRGVRNVDALRTRRGRR